MLNPDDHNPWDSWTTQHESTVAHPDAPRGGSGYGFSREAGESGAGWEDFEAIAPISPDGVHLMSEEAAVEYAADGFSRLSAKLRASLSWRSASAVARRILGRKSFGLSAGEAIAAEMKQAGAGVLGLQRALLFADIHDLLTGRIRTRSRDFDDPESWTDMGRQMMRREPGLSARRLKQAVDVRKNLVQEVAAFQRSAVPKPGAQPEWVSMVMTPTGRQPDAMHKAGEAFGKALAHCLNTLADARPSAADAKAGAIAYPNLAKTVQQMRAVATAGAIPAAKAAATTKPGAKPPPEKQDSSLSSNPTKSVPAPSEEERKLAAQENAQPDDGLNAARFSAREKVVRDFYEGRLGLGQARADQDMGCHPESHVPNQHPNGYGIDLSEPVKVADLPPPEQVHQYVKSHGNPGNFFDPIGGQTCDQLGLSSDPKMRQPKTFAVPATSPKQQALISKNGPVIDTWTDNQNPFTTKGGGTQMTVENTTRASLTPQPQPW